MEQDGSVVTVIDRLDGTKHDCANVLVQDLDRPSPR